MLIPCGRFAPTPSGLLHFGSLVTALASYLDVKSRKGKWLVRIEDIDLPRVQKGAAEHILLTLERFGLHWDGEVLYQSQRTHLYEDYLELLRTQRKVYPCRCSRKSLETLSRAEDGAYIYDGRCKKAVLSHNGEGRAAWRLDVEKEECVEWEDRIFGWQQQNVVKEVGDFILKRSDGYFSYHFVVVIDDFLSGVTDIVRGYDLLFSTARHIVLGKILGFSCFSYAHIPLATYKGQKLSKQNLAKPVDVSSLTLWRALKFLGQNPPLELQNEACSEIIKWGINNWMIEKVPRVSCCEVDF